MLHVRAIGAIVILAALCACGGHSNTIPESQSLPGPSHSSTPGPVPTTKATASPAPKATAPTVQPTPLPTPSGASLSSAVSMTAANGGSISLSDGSSASISAGALASDAVVQLSLVPSPQDTPPGANSVEVGQKLRLVMYPSGSPLQAHRRSPKDANALSITFTLHEPASVSGVITTANSRRKVQSGLPGPAFILPSRASMRIMVPTPMFHSRPIIGMQPRQHSLQQSRRRSLK